MATNYPGAVDSLTNPGAGDALDSPSHAGQHANANDAIEAVQTELGTDPSGASATVKARFEAIEANDWVTSARIAANAVGASELADNAVDTAAIADSAVTSAKIADGTIVNADINASAAIAATKISGTAVVASTVDAKGDLYVGTAADTVGRLAAGANSTMLVADSTAAAGMKWVPRLTVGATPPASPMVGAEWADTSSPPLTVIRKWDGTSWLVWIVTDAVVPSIGDAAWGGYMAGIIDTTRVGSIDGTDASQVGLRYLLIVSPKSIEYTTGLKWKTADTAGPAATNTRWDGLTATEAMYAAGADYQAATYCRNLSFPSDGGSRWYLPAKHELELLYRNLKPTTEPHYNASGANAASDPTGAAYTPGSADNPSRTGITAFQQGEAQALEGVSSPYYWSSSEYSALVAWYQGVGGTAAGSQLYDTKTSTNGRVRPVRRFVL